jgi:hypothetical protein
MVIFQTPGGSPGYNQFETLDEAVSFVEQLRNEQDVANARIFALEEIKFEFKPYFRVELQALTAGTAAPRAPEPIQAAPLAAPAPQVDAPLGVGAPESAAPVAGAFNAPAPVQPAPVAAPVPAPPAPAAPPADQPSEPAPVRRGLFGR